MTNDDLPPELRARLFERIARTPSPSRSQVLRRRALWLGLATAPLIGFAGMMGVDATTRPATMIGAGFAASLLVAAGSTRWVLGQGRTMLGRSLRELGLAAATAPLTLLLSFALVTHGLSEHGADNDARCAMMTVMLAAAPLLAFVFLERRTELREPATRGLALGAAAGAWPAVPMALTCGGTSLRHYAIAHVAPILLLALVGAWLGARLLGLRARQPAD